MHLQGKTLNLVCNAQCFIYSSLYKSQVGNKMGLAFEYVFLKKLVLAQLV